MTSPTSQFTATHLNPTTFLIAETATHGTHSNIYIKLFNDLLVIINTGHGTPGPLSLPSFLETTPIPGPTPKPINASKHEYIIALTSLHPTHTGHLSTFPPTTTTAFASSLSPPTTPTTPLEDTSLFPHVSISESPLTALHTPGITPCSLCIFDPSENLLFVGDFINPTVTFTLGADLNVYWESLHKLIEFVDTEGALLAVAATCAFYDDAAAQLRGTKSLLQRVLRREVAQVDKGLCRGGRLVEYREEVRAFYGPEVVFEEGRKALRGCF